MSHRVISCRFDGPLVVGQSVGGAIVLDLKKPLKVNSASLFLRFTGQTSWALFYAEEASPVLTYHNIKFEDVFHLVAKKGEISAGRTELPFQFELPLDPLIDVPHLSSNALHGFYFSPALREQNRHLMVKACWEAYLHIDVPWKRGIRETFTPVSLPRPPRERASSFFTQKKLKPVPKQGDNDVTEFTVSISKRIISPGEAVKLALRYRGNAAKPVTRIKVALMLSFPKLFGADGTALEEWRLSCAKKVANTNIPLIAKSCDITEECEWVVPAVGWSDENTLYHSKFYLRISADIGVRRNNPRVTGKITIAPEQHVHTLAAAAAALSVSTTISPLHAAAAAAAAGAAPPGAPLPTPPSSPRAAPEFTWVLSDGRGSFRARADDQEALLCFLPCDPVAGLSLNTAGAEAENQTLLGAADADDAETFQVAPVLLVRASRLVVTIISAVIHKKSGSTYSSRCVIRSGFSELKTDYALKTLTPEWNTAFKFKDIDLNALQFRIQYRNQRRFDNRLAQYEGVLDIRQLQAGVTRFTLPFLDGGFLLVSFDVQF